MYFANPSTGPVLAAMRAGTLGAICTPSQGNLIDGVQHWCADNGCGPSNRETGDRDTGGVELGKGYPGDVEFLAWLARMQPQAAQCWFAVAPDVVGDARATLKRSKPFLPVIRALGYPAALAAQNGLESLNTPWDTFDVLFIGGDDEWKLGRAAADLAAEARALGKRVHMGRVNSLKRLRYADAIGCASADGTHLTFKPRVRLPESLGWLRAVNDQGVLWAARMGDEVMQP